MKSSLVKILWFFLFVTSLWVAFAITFKSPVQKTVEVEVEEADCPAGTPYCPTPQYPEPAPIKMKAPKSAVRIMIRSGKSIFRGSGTIIRGSAKRAIVLTCAHIFQDENRRYPKKLPLVDSPITIDVFDTKVESFVAKCIAFDQSSDVGLITFDPGRRLEACAILPSGTEVPVGTKLFSVGCSGGQTPTVWPSQLVGQTKFQGVKRPVHVCRDAPVQGRSGGGLHLLSDGRLIGTCTGVTTDPGKAPEGIYPQSEAAWDLIRECKLADEINEPETESTEAPPTANIEPPKAEADEAKFFKNRPKAQPVSPTLPVPKLGQVNVSTPRLSSPSGAWVPDIGHYILGSAFLVTIGVIAFRSQLKNIFASASLSTLQTMSVSQPTMTQRPPDPAAAFDDRLHSDHTGSMRGHVAEFISFVEAQERRDREKAETEAKNKRLDDVTAKLFDAVRPTSAEKAEAPKS